MSYPVSVIEPIDQRVNSFGLVPHRFERSLQRERNGRFLIITFNAGFVHKCTSFSFLIISSEATICSGAARACPAGILPSPESVFSFPV